MPFKDEYTHKKIPYELRKNKRKLTDEQEEDIRQEYKTGLTSQRKLASKYKVSRRLITFVLCPEKREKAKQNFKERQKTGMYYNKEKQKIYSQKVRLRRKEFKNKNILE